MLENLSYKKKNKFLLYGGLLLLFLLYALFISDTIELHAVCSSLTGQVQMAQGAPEKVRIYEGRLTEMEKQLGMEQVQAKEGEVEQALLSTVANYCQGNGLVLREFPSTEQSAENDFKVQTNVFVVEGGFVKLLKLVYLLEQKQKLGKVSSVDFSSKKDYKTGLFALTAKVYIQNVKGQKV